MLQTSRAMMSHRSSAPEGWRWAEAGSDCHREHGWQRSTGESEGQGTQESCAGRKMRPSKGKGEGWQEVVEGTGRRCTS